MNLHRRKFLGLALAGLALAGGCRDLQGDILENPGTLEVLVTDQNNTPIVDVTATLIREVQNLVRRTANNGVARWDVVEPGARQFYVTPPAGFSGGGESDKQTVTVISGQTVKVTYKLTRN